MRAQLSWWGALTLGLLAQSTLFPLFLPDLWRPDLTRALVLWVALTGTPRLGGVLVPTMGALHPGHAALIGHGAAAARREGRPAGCVVSIFVNPTQFNDPADFAR